MDTSGIEHREWGTVDAESFSKVCALARLLRCTPSTAAALCVYLAAHATDIQWAMPRKMVRFEDIVQFCNNEDCERFSFDDGTRNRLAMIATKIAGGDERKAFRMAVNYAYKMRTT